MGEELWPEILKAKSKGASPKAKVGESSRNAYRKWQAAGAISSRWASNYLIMGSLENRVWGKK